MPITTTLAVAVGAADTTITVDDADLLPEPPFDLYVNAEKMSAEPAIVGNVIPVRRNVGTTALKARDDFAPEITDKGWGFDDLGNRWASASASKISFWKTGSAGIISATVAGSTPLMRCEHGSLLDMEVLQRFLVPQVPTAGGSGGLDGRTGLRMSGTASLPDGYYVAAQINELGNINLRAREITANVESTVGGATNPSAAVHDTTTPLWMRARITGAATPRIQARVWRDGTTEPTNWEIDVTDATPSAAQQLPGASWAWTKIESGYTGTLPVNYTVYEYNAWELPPASTHSIGDTVTVLAQPTGRELPITNGVPTFAAQDGYEMWDPSTFTLYIAARGGWKSEVLT